MTVRHPAWREFEGTCAWANDGTQAALLGLDLALEHLDEVPSARRLFMLPDIVQAEEAERLNLPVAEVEEELRKAESQVAAMAIPFAIAVLSNFLAVTLETFNSAGVGVTAEDPTEMQLGKLRDTLTAHCKVAVRTPTRQLLDFVQRLRNDIVHSGGRVSQKLVDRWADLGTQEREFWEKVTGGAPRLNLDEPVVLGRKEVYVSWSLIRGYAREVNDSMAARLPREAWARIAAEDFEQEWPTKLADRTRKPKYAARYARTRFGDLKLTEEELKPFL